MKVLNTILIIITASLFITFFWTERNIDKVMVEFMRDSDKLEDVKMKMNNLKIDRQQYLRDSVSKNYEEVSELEKLISFYMLNLSEDYSNVIDSLNKDLDDSEVYGSSIPRNDELYWSNETINGLVNVLHIKNEKNFKEAVISELLLKKDRDVIDRLKSYYYLENETPELRSTTTLKENIIFNYLSSYRKPKELLEAFNESKEVFYGLITEETYRGILEPHIEKLFKTYKRAKKLPENISYYDKINKENKSADLWYETFWFRRYLEKNIDETYYILKKIEKHYLIGD